MSINDTISKLFEAQHVVEVLFGRTPEGRIYCQAKQLITTAEHGGRCNVVHQVEGASVTESVAGIVRAVEHCMELQSNIVPVRRDGN